MTEGKPFNIEKRKADLEDIIFDLMGKHELNPDEVDLLEKAQEEYDELCKETEE